MGFLRHCELHDHDWKDMGACEVSPTLRSRDEETSRSCRWFKQKKYLSLPKTACCTCIFPATRIEAMLLDDGDMSLHPGTKQSTLRELHCNHSYIYRASHTALMAHTPAIATE